MPLPSVLLIVNPVAGQDEPAEMLERIEAYLGENTVRHEIRRTTGEGDALKWAREASGFDLVLVGGGDGTVMEAMSGMVKNPRPIPLGQIPLGTANLLARALAIPTDLDDALRLAVHDGVVATMDVGYLPDHDRYFALVAGSGWDAALIEDADRHLKDKLGFFAYVLTGIKNLFTLKDSRICVTIDGETHRFRAHTVMVINVGEIHGTGIALGSGMSPHDGKLDLAIASPRSVWRILKLIIRLMRKRFDDYEDLSYFTASHLKVEATPPLKLELDGEPIGHTPFEVEVVPSGVRLVVPREYAVSKKIDAEPLLSAPGRPEKSAHASEKLG